MRNIFLLLLWSLTSFIYANTQLGSDKEQTKSLVNNSLVSNPYELSNFIQINTAKLKNGLRIIFIPYTNADIIYHSVWYGVGSADEDPSIPLGLAHFFEHMMFRGTPKFPDGSISKQILKSGGLFNAATSYDFTFYYIKIASHDINNKDNLDLAMSIEADRMANLVINPSLVKIESSAIQEERNFRVNNQPERQLAEETFKTMFKKHGYGYPIIGYDNDIQSYDAVIAKNFYRTWYNPANAVLIVIGNTCFDKVKELAEKHYGRLAKSAPPKRKRIAEPKRNDNIRSKIQLVTSQRQIPEYSMVFAAPCIREDGFPACAALDILLQIIGASKTSTLYKKLVIERKLASDISSNFQPFTRDRMIFSIDFTPNPGVDIKALTKAIKEEMNEIITKGIDPVLVEKAKNRQLVGLEGFKDSVEGIANLIGSLVAADYEIEDLQKYFNQVAQTTVAQVNQALKLFIAPGPHLRTILLPQIQAKEPYQTNESK